MRDLIGLIALIVIIVIILQIVVFHRMHHSQEERDKNMHKLWLVILVTIVVAIVLGYLMKDGIHMGDGEEYGVFSEAKRNVKNYWARQKEYRQAKREGLTDEEAKVRRSAVKQNQQKTAVQDWWHIDFRETRWRRRQ